MKTTGWGIIGPGAIAQNFADGLAEAPSGRLVAIASRNPARRDAFGARNGVEPALPQSVWRTILRTGRFRRDSGDFKEALVARERCFRSKR